MTSPTDLAATDTDLRRIARGQQPEPFEKTFDHRLHGELTFRVPALPRATALAAHSIEMDNLLAEMAAEPSPQTRMLVAAIAGLKAAPGVQGVSVLGVELPVIGQTETEVEDRGSTRVERVFYDAEAEVDEGFLVDVWLEVSMWRRAFFTQEAVERLGESAGETSGGASSEPSSEPSDSPSTTRA